MVDMSLSSSLYELNRCGGLGELETAAIVWRADEEVDFDTGRGAGFEVDFKALDEEIDRKCCN